MKLVYISAVLSIVVLSFLDVFGSLFSIHTPLVFTGSYRIIAGQIPYLDFYMPVGPLVFSVTRKGAKGARRFFSNAIHLPACIDPRRFRSKEEGSFSRDRLRIICVSKYIRRKNIDVLILAFEKLVDLYPDIILVSSRQNRLREDLIEKGYSVSNQVSVENDRSEQTLILSKN